MDNNILPMSRKELSRLEVVQKMEDGVLSQREAADLLGLSVRQVRRLLRAYRTVGAPGLVSKRRGQPSNNRLSEEIKQQAIDLLHAHYHDFRPTLACEKLAERHQIKISKETVRKLMIAEGLWKPKRAQKITVHQMRERRACYGELIQIDGSPHDWFEGRGPECTLLVFIDDATGRLMELYFAESETTNSYWAALRRYFARHGKPRAFYSDKHGIFRINKPGAVSGSGMTQFGRSMKELDIEIICANTPQAKGRVERVNSTLQDRLVKEMRLEGISGIEEANLWSPEYMTKFNAQFAVQPRSTHDAHKPLLTSENLDQIFTMQETRILSKNLTLQYKKVIYQIQTKRPGYAMRKAAVTVCERANGEIEILHRGHALAYSIFKKQPRQAEVVTSKSLDKAVKKTWRPPADHPWRNYPVTNDRVPIEAASK